MRTPRKPEVKSPAGHWPQLRAAVEAGADAVYFGLKKFTARAKAGFSNEELPAAVAELHSRGVRGYITFNTLIFENELREAARQIEIIARSGADGIIVQDLAAVRLVREIAPDLEIHGSTQMTVTDASGVDLAQRLGVSRVTLARELSLEETAKISEATSADLEIFVHGALCVAYSGQCFSSEAWGGRSANRGQCAQACRLPYELLVDGAIAPTGDARYLLSPGDLYALKQIPEIIQMGIAAIKIEGRYKDAEYVALTTQAYRKAVDEAWAGLPLSVTPNDELQLEQVYSRGLGPYFLTGTNHQTVVRGRAPRHRGVHMGEVVKLEIPGVVILKPAHTHQISPLKLGDGVVFDAAAWRSPQEPEEGGRIFEVRQLLDGNLKLGFANGAIKLARIRPGDFLWRSDDSQVTRAAKVFTEATSPRARQKVDVIVTAKQGDPLTTQWTLPRSALSVTLHSQDPLTTAARQPLSEATLREQLGRLGGTAFELGQLTLHADSPVFVPVSLLNQIRREAVEQLAQLQAAPHKPNIRQVNSLKTRAKVDATQGSVSLHLLVRNVEQLNAALDLAPASITLDYLDLYGLRPSVERVKAKGIVARVASPRVLKPGEVRITNFLADLDCSILVRAAGMLDALREKTTHALIGDFSLNAANTITADELFGLGVTRLTPTHDLNAAQVEQFISQLGGQRIEVIAYQHLPVFHTEHCVFCRFLSTGTSYKDCGRPCEKHRVALKDDSGRAHPVIADVGCRNTVFGAEAQEASGHLERWLEAGAKHLRLEFVEETPKQVRGVHQAFADACAGRIAIAELSQKLAALSPQGTTEGSLFVPVGERLVTIGSSNATIG